MGWNQPLGTQTDKVRPSPRNGNIRTVTCASFWAVHIRTCRAYVYGTYTEYRVGHYMEWNDHGDSLRVQLNALEVMNGRFLRHTASCQPNRRTKSASQPCLPRVSSRAKKMIKEEKKNAISAKDYRDGFRPSERVPATGGGGALRKGSVTAMGAFPIRNKPLQISKGLLVQSKYQIPISAYRSAMHTPVCTPLLLAKLGKMHTGVVKEHRTVIMAQDLCFQETTPSHEPDYFLSEGVWRLRTSSNVKKCSQWGWAMSNVLFRGSWLTVSLKSITRSLKRTPPLAPSSPVFAFRTSK
ncbi:uncharacterized protein B0T23DRAFT_405410 [Neurospora hispaniola]|uniref:Uncharacterized protein n=1 Tax=Neurospora hispaniola TaxID=588809 RepID=A0AAJ0MQL6_9PEZI|nr:hypothetical protein B0T23DRAFT_405410 [Neurospora hispaniola]